MKAFEAGDRYIVRKDRYSNDTFDFTDHVKELPSLEARLMLECIEKWGLVMAKPDGEDSSGRSKLTLMSPDELVSRAANVAELAVKAIREKGWMVEMPAPDVLYADDKPGQ